MSNFHEVRFPTTIAVGASGGPQRGTDILTLASGAEERNARHANARRRFNAGVGLSSLTQIQTLVRFFEERRGQLYGFRFRDPLDCSATGQNIGTGTGVVASFALRKTYGVGTAAYVRMISKPVAGTVRVFVNSVEKTLGTHWNVDVATGVVTFTSGNIPPSAAAITANFEFDVPVRFDVEALDIKFNTPAAGEVLHVPLIEIIP